jgi:DnaA regulatory inactivator Hda
MTEPAAARQLLLDLTPRPALGREDFLVAPCNRIAALWIDRWPDWPAPGLALYGPPGCGKSHLAAVWQAASGALALDPAELSARATPELLGKATACVLDRADQVLSDDPVAERALLHLFNVLMERGGFLLLAGRRAPAQWPVGLPDLRSRLAMVQAAELGAPDDRLIEALLVKHFADRQLRVGPEVVRFLLARMERSFTAAQDLVAAIDQSALAAHREITVPLARAVLERLDRAADDKTHEYSGRD